MKIRIKLYYILITFFMMIGVVFAEVISKDPNYIKDRGYPDGYKFPGHTIYFAEVSFAKERSKLKTSK